MKRWVLAGYTTNGKNGDGSHRTVNTRDRGLELSVPSIHTTPISNPLHNFLRSSLYLCSSKTLTEATNKAKMASLTIFSSNSKFGPLHSPPTTTTTARVPSMSAQLYPFNKLNNNSLRLSSARNISGSHSLFSQKPCTISSLTQKFQSLTVFAAKGYKMKTHKASAKRFRVTGRGKIVRRRAGKQHLLAKKNTKRKLRLSKMHPVARSDYDNVIGTLPYLKVNRNAK